MNRETEELGKWLMQSHYCSFLGKSVTNGFCDSCSMTEHCSESINNN